MAASRPVRIGNVSGATGDSPTAMVRMARDGNVDVIVGDWLSEMNIAWNAITKMRDPEMGYDPGFLAQLEDSLDLIMKNGIRVVTNAGALNTPSLAKKVEELCWRRGHYGAVVASVLGDDISELVKSADSRARLNLHHLDHPDWLLSDWELEPHSGVAYIGSWGIVEALRNDAQIVICGRVADASPVMGAAAWWHGWSRESWDELAGSLVAGHLIECGPYVTGANFSGFKSFLEDLVDLGFPIAEIDRDGTCVVTKCDQHAGHVTKHNTIAQLLYELQGETYLNSDVVAHLGSVDVQQAGPDRVRVTGARGSPPPATTKAMIAAPGGYQAEATFYINGLDVEQKAQMMRQQLDCALKDHGFCKWSVELYGSPVADPRSQQAGTVSLRVFAQARRKEDIDAAHFKMPIYALRMQSYPGYHMNLDFRTMDPKQFMEIFPAVIPLPMIDHRVRLSTGRVTSIPPSAVTATYPVERPSYETAAPRELGSFGLAERAPLGSIVHARSGDKADNCNIGFFVRHEEEYPWLQAFLTVDRLKWLFGDDWLESRVERCEFPKIWAVHFRVLDFLGGGIASSSRLDGLGKGVGEYLRSRVVEIPTRFLRRGAI